MSDLLTRDDLKVPRDVNYFYARINSDGNGLWDINGKIIKTNATVILKPSEASKYMNVVQCETVGIGVMVYQYMIDMDGADGLRVIKRSSDDYWAYVDFGGYVRMTPADVLEMDGYEDPNPDMAISNNGFGPEWDQSLYTRETEYNAENCPILKLINAKLYTMPDLNYDTGDIINTIIPATSKWKNPFDNTQWYGVYYDNDMYYVRTSNTVTQTSGSKYYSMVYGDISCEHMLDMAPPLQFHAGDILYKVFQIPKTPTYCITYKFDTGEILAYGTYFYNTSPNVHNPNVFDAGWLGSLICQHAVPYKIIDIEEINKKSSKKYKLDYNTFETFLNDDDLVPLINDAYMDVTDFIAVNHIIDKDHKDYFICCQYENAERKNYNWYIIYYDKSKVEYSPIKYIPIMNNYGGPMEQNTAEYQDWTNADKTDVQNETSVRPETVAEHNIGNENTDPFDDWWEVELKQDDATEIPGIIKNAPEVEPEDDNWALLTEPMKYELKNNPLNDNRHMRKFNRFRFIVPESGLSTKSFLFFTRPDLNIFQEQSDGSINRYTMNADLKRLPTFKYIARLQDACRDVTEVLQQSASDIGPWLYPLSNQARGFSIENRTLDKVETGETFHGNKVIYAEPTFSHKIAGTFSVPFLERRDLSLYYTLRMWVDYIQAVSMGRCSPRNIHIQNHELDYAVSAYYITTDETMENILYWEKLIGVFPLTVPDSFFSWNEDDNARDMKYTIDFAYSFRAIQDELHLLEINNMYKNDVDGITGIASSHYNFNYVYDDQYSVLLSKLAASYGHIADTDDARNAFTKDKAILEKYYYANNVNISNSGYNILSGDGSKEISNLNAKFLPNWIPGLQTHGVPYVQGPFITKEMERDNDNDLSSKYITGKYKLRWV